MPKFERNQENTPIHIRLCFYELLNLLLFHSSCDFDYITRFQQSRLYSLHRISDDLRADVQAFQDSNHIKYVCITINLKRTPINYHR